MKKRSDGCLCVSFVSVRDAALSGGVDVVLWRCRGREREWVGRSQVLVEWAWLWGLIEGKQQVAGGGFGGFFRERPVSFFYLSILVY